MSKNTFPDLGAINRQLATSNARVLHFLDSLPDGVDQLVDATEQSNWAEVNRLSKTLAYGAEMHGFEELADTARDIGAAFDNPDTQTEIRRRVIRLIGRCGRTRPVTSRKRPNKAAR